MQMALLLENVKISWISIKNSIFQLIPIMQKAVYSFESMYTR